MSEQRSVIGACGKKLAGLCYPDFEDDLCAVCPWNGWENEDDISKYDEEVQDEYWRAGEEENEE